MSDKEYYLIDKKVVGEFELREIPHDKPNMVVFTSGDKKYIIDMKLLKELRE